MRARGSVRGRVRVQVRVWVRARVRRGHLVGLHLSLAREAGDLALHDDGAGRLHDVLEGDRRRLDPHLHLGVHLQGSPYISPISPLYLTFISVFTASLISAMRACVAKRSQRLTKGMAVCSGGTGAPSRHHTAADCKRAGFWSVRWPCGPRRARASFFFTTPAVPTPPRPSRSRRADRASA